MVEAAAELLVREGAQSDIESAKAAIGSSFKANYPQILAAASGLAKEAGMPELSHTDDRDLLSKFAVLTGEAARETMADAGLLATAPEPR